MMKNLRWSMLMLVLLAAGFLLVPATANAGCYEYYNSTKTYVYGYGYVCAGNGGTCTECVDGGGGSCVFDGSGSCSPTQEHQW